MNYEQAKELLTSQGKFYINLGLERVQSILKLIGNPQEKIKVIHIAGTNGKGSVSSILANILKCQGYKTGLYTSPHLVEYTERIKINNEEISKEDFANYIEKICNLAEKNNIHLTEFEILTVTAYKYFADKKVKIAVIETGLGGRYDATNVCKKPLLSIITSISFDHTDRLGNTIEKIAFEKAGIIKPKSAVITEISNKGFKIIKEVSEEKKSKLIVATNYVNMNYENGTNYVAIEDMKCEFPMLGLYQKGNLSIVMQAVEFLKIKKKAIAEGLKTVHWGARLEFIKDKNVLIDGAHNPDAAKELKKSLDFYFGNQKKIFLYSTLNTKDYVEISKILFEKDDEILFYEFNNKNAVSFEEFRKNNPQLENVKKFNKNDLHQFLQHPELKIITGSLYMIGELYNELKN